MAKVVKKAENIENVSCDSCGVETNTIYEISGHKHWDLICPDCLDFEEQLGVITDDIEED